MGDNGNRRARALAAARSLLAAGVLPSAEAVAAAAGLSRSTYYRVAGGSHQALLREAGHVSEPAARTRILDATAALLDEVGFAGLLMDAVAERAGVSRATLYRLFPGKAELLAELARTRAPLAALGARLMAVSDLPPADVLPHVVAAIMPRLLASRGLLRAVLAQAAVTGPDAAAGRTAVSVMYATLVAYLEHQMQAGRLRRVDPLAAVQALIGPLLAHAVLQPSFWAEIVGDLPPPEQTSAEVVQIWLRGMQPERPNP